MEVKTKEHETAETKLQQALGNEKGYLSNIQRLEAEKKDLLMKNTALAEQLALLRGQGDSSTQDILAWKTKYNKLVQESQDYKSKADLLLESEKTVSNSLRKEIEAKSL